MSSVYIQSSVFLPTPSGGAGAVELLVAKMAEGLAKRGWDVTLWALSGSQVEGVRVVTVHNGTPEDRERELQSTMNSLAIALPPDVIFDHSLHMFAGQRRGPYVAMSHGMAPLPSWAHNVVFTSKHHGRLHGRKEPQALLLGIDLSDIPPLHVEPTWVDGRIVEVSMAPREGLFWAGRIMPYKRLHLACEIARLAKQPLRLAGPIIDERYAREVWDEYDIHDFSQGGLRCQDEVHVHYLGELPRAQVLEEMARARCFLFTSDETEPAGLVMLEAMACGTQVIALAGNAATEYVLGDSMATSGGWVCNGVAEAVTFVHDHLPFAPRQHVETRFKISDMVDRAEEYLQLAIQGRKW